jgi:hypothetical protein
MSDKPEDKYEISLNTYALVSILRSLQTAKEYLSDAEAEKAEWELEAAWCMLPNKIRAKFPDDPHTMIRKAQEVSRERQLGLDFQSVVDTTWKRVFEGYIKELDAAGLYISVSKTRRSLKDFPHAEKEEEDDGDHTPIPA